LVPLITADRTTGVAAAPVCACGHVRFMALRTPPSVLLPRTPGHLNGGGGVIGVPLPRQPGVCSHRLALTYSMSAPAERAADFASKSSQVINPGFPLMLLATPMCAPETAQPDLLHASMGEVRRLVALVEVWVPPGLDEVVLRVRQGLVSPVVEAC